MATYLVTLALDSRKRFFRLSYGNLTPPLESIDKISKVNIFGQSARARASFIRTELCVFPVSKVRANVPKNLQSPESRRLFLVQLNAILSWVGKFPLPPCIFLSFQLVYVVAV